MLHAAALLTADQSRAADKAAQGAGTPGETLMENAGRAVVDVICQHFAPCRVLITCGTGNKGGDGFVTARLLKKRNWDVTLTIIGDTTDLELEAHIAKDKWNMSGGATRTFSPTLLEESDLVIDAMIGTGLKGDLRGIVKSVVLAVNDSKLPVVSIDIPSGVNADSGAIMGTSVNAVHTVTFGRPKLGHVLLPGKARTGQLHVYDIGISGEGIKPTYYLNTPALWSHAFPKLAPDTHKYSRGHAVVMGGTVATTGASRLAAMGALRAGAGLVSVACTPETLPVYVTTLTAIMTKPYAKSAQLQSIIGDERVTAMLIGPGHGVDESTREHVLQLLALKKPCVLDADALTSFENNSKALFAAISGPVVMTPHEGEFSRLFTTEGIKTARAQSAARQSKSVIVLKGNDTVIAAPDGRVAVNANAPVWLATAGSGDVLGGIITGLLAQGMEAFEAACAGVWLHGEAASHFGPGLIAEDLPGALPAALKSLHG